MSTGEDEQNKTSHNFIILVDDNGKFKISPSNHGKEVVNDQIGNQKIGNESRKKSRRGKQRIRIALLEDVDSSSEEELDDSNVTRTDAQAETMHDQLVKMHNEKLSVKPSFVVLEDALVRRRMEKTLQSHCNRTICHSHAEQQTSACDIDAHTGSQNEELPLHCAVRSKMLSQLSNNKTNQALEKPLVESVGAASAPTRATTNNTVPHLTISFIAPNSQTAPQQQQQPLLSAAPAIGPNNNWNSCPNLPTPGSYQQIPATTHYCEHANFQQPQVQQQQFLGTPATYGNCCSSWCLLRPTSTQTSLGYCHSPGVSSQCSHHLLQPPQLYPTTRLSPQRINNSHCYPMQCHCQRYKAYYENQQQQHQLLHDQYICPVDRIASPSPLPRVPSKRENRNENNTQEETFLTMHK